MKSKPLYLASSIIGAALLIAVLFYLPISGLGTSTRSAQAAPEALAFTTQQITTNTITNTRPAIAVDGNGKTHIAYEQDGDIYYTTDASGVWITDKIAGAVWREFKPSIAVDSSGYAHISYYAGASSPYNLFYSKGGLWNGEIIQTVSVPHPDYLDGGIALDGAGLPYVVYVIHDGNDFEIGMRYHDGAQLLAPNAGWTTEVITDNPLNDEHPSIAVQSDGKVHIAYQQNSPFTSSIDIHYATNASGSWMISEVVDSALDDTNPSIALDENHKPHIAYKTYDMLTGAGTGYVTLSGVSWITSTLSSGYPNVQGVSIIVDSQNKAHVIFNPLESSEYLLVYATNMSSAWVTETLPLSSTAKLLTPMDRPLAIDSSGFLHIAYYNASDNSSEIYYAKSDQSVASNGSCAAPRPIACGEQVAGNTAGKANNINSYTCSSWNESGPEEIYAFTLAAGDTYSVTAQLLGYSSADLDIFLLGTSGCDAGQCLDGNSSGEHAASATGVVPGTYYISVDGYNGVSGSYTMRLTCETEGGANTPPKVPSNPSPSGSAAGVSLDPVLSWDTGDVDNEQNCGYAYYSETNPPLLSGSNMCNECRTGNDVRMTCSLLNLTPNTTYYWQVVVEDQVSSSTGPVWSFTTVSKIYLPHIQR